MDNKNALKLLSEALRTVRDTTSRSPNGFHVLLGGFVMDLRDISNHIINKNLRKCVFLLYTLAQPLRESFSTIMQKKIHENLENIFEQIKLDEGLKEIIRYAAGSVTASVISDEQARKVIDTDQLLHDVSSVLEGLDDTLKAKVLSIIAGSIRGIYSEFVEQGSEEMIAFYNSLIEACKKDWSSVSQVITDYMIARDDISLVWR